MGKERFALDQIKKILKEPMEAWEAYEKDPFDDNARDGWLQAQPSSQDLIEIFRLLKINDLIQEAL